MTGGGSRIVAPMPPALDTLLEPVYGRALLCLYARCDGSDHGRSHFELIPAVLDPVPPRDPIEVGVDSPHFGLVVLEHEKPHRPIQAGICVGSDELRPEWRIAEDKQHRRLQLDPGVRGQLRLVDLAEELDAFV